MNEDNWANLTDRQRKILSVSGKLEVLIGVFTGYWYAAVLAGNKDATQIAFELKRDAAIARSQFLEVVNEDTRMEIK